MTLEYKLYLKVSAGYSLQTHVDFKAQFLLKIVWTPFTYAASFFLFLTLLK